MKKNIASHQKSFLQGMTHILKVVALLGATVLALFIPTETTHASVMSDYIASLTRTLHPTGTNDADRVQSYIASLNTCLGNANQWQWSPTGGSAPTTPAQLASRLEETAHPCRGHYSNLTLVSTTTPPAPAPAPANPPAPAPANPPASTSTDPSTSQPPAPTDPNPSTLQQPAPANPAPNPNPSTSSTVTIYGGPKHVDVTAFSAFGAVSIDRIINNVIAYISGLLAILAVASLIYGGVLYMTAGGDTGKIGKAKEVLILTFVGLVFASLAYMVVVFATRIFYS